MSRIEQVTKINIGKRLGEWVFALDPDTKREVVEALNKAIAAYETDYQWWITVGGNAKPSDEQTPQDKASVASEGKLAYAKHAVVTFFADTAKKILTNSAGNLRAGFDKSQSRNGLFVTTDNFINVLTHRDFAESSASHTLVQLRYSLKQRCVDAIFSLFAKYIEKHSECQRGELVVAQREYGKTLSPMNDADLADTLYTAAMGCRPHTEASVINFFRHE